MNCPKCNETAQSRGFQRGKSRYWCSNSACHELNKWKGWFSVEDSPSPEDVRMLTIDIETAPILMWNWGLSTPQRRMSIKNLERDNYMLSWAAKWSDEDEVLHDVLTPDESLERNDKRIVERLWKLLEEPHAVISHNGRTFDIPYINDRYAEWGLGPNQPYKLIDTYTIAKRLRSTSHKLDYLAQRHLRNQKVDTDFELWIRCAKGDAEALEKMDEYNVHDVAIGEQIYFFLRPWEYGPLNHGLFSDADSSVCRSCGSKDIHITGKMKPTPVNLYPVYRCKNCGYCGTMRKSAIDSDRRKLLTK